MTPLLIAAAVGMIVAGFLTAVGVLSLISESEPPEKGVLSEDVYREEFADAEDSYREEFGDAEDA